ncbi:1503_t:CDS:2, partial [Ambispora leptoticha]
MYPDIIHFTNVETYRLDLVMGQYIMRGIRNGKSRESLVLMKTILSISYSEDFFLATISSVLRNELCR